MKGALLALLCCLALSKTFAAPADLQRLEELKEKLRSLHEVLDELNQNIDNLESGQEKKEFAEVPPPADPNDEELQDFIEHLSAEDKEVVEHMKSKLKFLQATVHEEPGHDIPAADGYAEEQPVQEEEPEKKRGMSPEVQNLYDGLSAEDQALLKEHPSMWSHLDKALRTHGGNAADVVAAAAQKKSEDSNLHSYVSQLSNDDQELLRRMKSKLSNLKTALRSQKSPVDEVERRLLNDVRYAKEHGVSLKQVLETLAEAKRRA